MEFQSEIALLHHIKIEFQHNTQAFLTGKPPTSPQKPFRPNENPLPTTAGHYSDAQTGTQRSEPHAAVPKKVHDISYCHPNNASGRREARKGE